MPTIPPKQERKEYEIVKAGTHVGIAYQIIHLGTHKTNFQGQEKTAYKIRVSFELPNLKKSFKEGEPAKPMVISQKLSLSMFSKSKLRPLVEGIIGISLPDDVAESFDVEEILGKPCLLSIKHETYEGKTYATVASTAQMIESMPVPIQTNPNKVINLFQTWNEEAYKALSDFIRKDIDSSLERTKKASPIKNEVNDEVEKFDASTIEYPEADSQDIPF